MKQLTSPRARNASTRPLAYSRRRRRPVTPSSLPFKDGIVELRHKGASLRLIRELLATVDVAVGTDTIARFLAEMNGDPMPQRPAKRTGRRRVAAPRPVRHQAAVASPSPAATPQPSAPGDPPADATRSDAPAERSRMRGPRIADPRNL